MSIIGGFAMNKVKNAFRKGRISEENYVALMEDFGEQKCKEIADVDYFSISDSAHYSFSFIFQDGQKQTFHKKVNPLKEAVFVSYTMGKIDTVYIHIYQPKVSAYVSIFYSLDAIKNTLDFFHAFNIQNGIPLEENAESLSSEREYLFISKEPISSENGQSAHLMARYHPK